MLIVLFLAFYIIGYILAYIMFRIDTKKHSLRWTTDDRINGLCIATFSWIAVLGHSIKVILNNS